MKKILAALFLFSGSAWATYIPVNGSTVTVAPYSGAAFPIVSTNTINVSQQGSVAVTGTFFQTTQPVYPSGGVFTVQNSTNPLIFQSTSPLPVSGTFYQGTQPVSVATPYQVFTSSFGTNGSTVAASIIGTVPVSMAMPLAVYSNGGVYTVTNSTNPLIVQSTSTLPVSLNTGLGVYTVQNSSNPLVVSSTSPFSVSGSSVVDAGNLADNGVSAGSNRLPTLPAIYQTSYLNGTAATQGRNGALSQGTDGLLWVGQLPSIRPASFHASTFTVLAANPTDTCVMPGNATNTVLVTRVVVTSTQTTAGMYRINLFKRSAADTSGTTSSMIAVPDDSNYSAAVSAPIVYTANPTLGTLVGPVDTWIGGAMAPATTSPNDLYIGNFRQKPIVLRGVAQQLAVNLGGNAMTGGTIACTFEWIETATILP